MALSGAHQEPVGSIGHERFSGEGTSKFKRAAQDLSHSLKLTEIWVFLGFEDIIARYKMTLLGPLWNAAFIVAQALALSIVFGAVFKSPIALTMPYILSGMLAWQLGPLSVLDSSGLLLGVAGTIKSQNLPYILQVFRNSLRNFLIFLHNIVALLIIFPMFGHMPIINWTIVFAVPAIVLASTPYMLVVAIVCARFRDVQMLIMNFSPVLFFLTPVFWNPDLVGGRRSAMVMYNPLTYMVDLVRKPLLNLYPTMMDWIVVGGIFGVGLILAILVFVPSRSKIPHWV